MWVSPDENAALYVGEAIETLSRIPDESVDCVWTDPPYLLSNGGITCVAGRMVSVDKGDWDKSRGLELDHQFNMEWVGGVLPRTEADGDYMGDGNAACISQRGDGAAAKRLPAAERHSLGEAEPSAQSGAQDVHPLDGDRAVGKQGSEGQPPQVHVQL